MTTIDPETIGGQRHYRIDGSPYPSVTEITNAYKPKREKIHSWEAKLRAEGKDPNRVKQRAAQRGTIVHHRILDPHAIRTLEPPTVDMGMLDDDMMAEIETCMILWDDLDYRIGDNPYVEQTIWSHEYEYAGTFDLLSDGTIVDLKTSKGAFDSHKMQIAAYHKAIHETGKFPEPRDAHIIVLNPDPETNNDMTADIVRLSPTEINHWFDKFLRVLDIFNNQDTIV